MDGSKENRLEMGKYLDNKRYGKKRAIYLHIFDKTEYSVRQP